MSQYNYCPHFTDEETEAGEVPSLVQSHTLVRKEIKIQVPVSREPNLSSTLPLPAFTLPSLHPSSPSIQDGNWFWPQAIVGAGTGEGLNMKGLRALSSLPLLQRRMGSHCPLPPRSPSLRPPAIHAPVSRQPAQKGRVFWVPGGAAHRLPATFHHRLPPPPAVEVLPALRSALSELLQILNSPLWEWSLVSSAPLSTPQNTAPQTLPREQAWTQAWELLPAPVLCGLLAERVKLTLAPTCWALALCQGLS